MEYKLKQIKPGYFVLCNSAGFPMHVTLARANFSNMARQLKLK